MRSADSFGARTHDAGIGPGLVFFFAGDSSAGRLPESVPTGRALSFPPRRSNDGKRDDTPRGRHDTGPLRAGTVGSIGESAPGRIVTELLFSHRNDAQLVLTGIAKAQPQHGTAPPNSAWRASRQALGWNKTKAPQDAGQHRITSSVDGTATSQSGGLPSSGYGNAELKSRTNACTRGRNCSGY